MTFNANIPDKTVDKNTTSHKFKHDLMDFFTSSDIKIENCLEIGTNHGWTTHILSKLFNNVTTIDFYENNIAEAKKNNFAESNITYIVGDAYTDFTYSNIHTKFDAVFIDCVHDYNHVMLDINRALTYKRDDAPIYLIFDDYGHPESTGVKDAIDDAIKGGLCVERYIGEASGYSYNKETTLIDHEGIILSYGKEN